MTAAVQHLDLMKLVESLMMKEIIVAAGPGLLSYQDQRCHANLLAAVEKSELLQAKVKDAYERKMQWTSDIQNEGIKQAHFHNNSQDHEEVELTSMPESYPTSPSEEVKHSCLAKFIDRTSNGETTQASCIVCACEVFIAEMEHVDLDDLPGRHLLVPFV